MDDFSIRELSKGDMKDILALQELVHSEMPDKTHYICFDKKDLKDDFKHGALSLGARNNQGELVAYSLMLKDGTVFEEEIAEHLGISVDELCCHEAVIIREDYRGRGLQRRFMVMSEQHMKEAGYKAIWCCAHPDNIYSVSNIEKRGFVFYKDVVAWGGFTRRLFIKDLREDEHSIYGEHMWWDEK